MWSVVETPFFHSASLTDLEPYALLVLDALERGRLGLGDHGGGVGRVLGRLGRAQRLRRVELRPARLGRRGAPFFTLVLFHTG